ncbi:MAG TPA: DUF5681 domain-containing protein [Acidobacteriaceae bacterium]
MGKKKALGDYEVGYGKPPKHTQFLKDVSGNPKGCPKKTPAFAEALLREARTLMTINENGKPKRVSKNDVLAKQLYKLAMTGNIAAARLVLAYHRDAQENDAFSSEQRAGDLDRFNNVENFTDEELERLFAFLAEQEKRKGQVPSAE